MSDHEKFLRYADTCMMLANEGGLAPHRAMLQQMAQSWRRLAAEEERIADLIREVDKLFSAPDVAAGARMRPENRLKAAVRSL